MLLFMKVFLSICIVDYLSRFHFAQLNRQVNAVFAGVFSRFAVSAGIAAIFFILLVMPGQAGAEPSSPALTLNTFLGSATADGGNSIAVDKSGNIYIAGTSDATWGSPVNAHAGGDEVLVVKLDASGALLWHTFLGSATLDSGNAVAVDGSENIYVVGASDATWGTPLAGHAGVDDIFIAKLDNSGVLQWNMFLGSAMRDIGYAVAVDGSGNVYCSGYSGDSWGTPVSSFVGERDITVAKLNSAGVLQWHTFHGTADDDDEAYSVTVDGSGSVYLAGISRDTWGTPVRAYTGGRDAVALKLNSSGVLQWHTFLGTSGNDYGRSVAVDESGNVFVAGDSATTWESPVSAHSGGSDAFAAGLDSSGVLQWNTFMGSAANDLGRSLAVDGSRNLYISGNSPATWGTPMSPFAAGEDAFVVELSTSGTLLWHTFLGADGFEYGRSVAVDETGKVYVAGDSSATWGSPVYDYTGGADIFAAVFYPLYLNDVILDFGSQFGVWVEYNDDSRTWGWIHDAGVESISACNLDNHEGQEIIMDFGSGTGAWANYNDDPAGWGMIHASSPELVAVGDLDDSGQDEVILDFGTATGVWANYDDNPANWRKVHASSPELMAVGDLDTGAEDDLILDFGAGVGVWVNYNDDPNSWRMIHASSPELMAVGDLDNNGQDEVILDFGTATGVWANYNDDPLTWRRIHTFSPELMAVGDLDNSGQDEVILDFGTATGVWAHYNDNPSTWRRIHLSSPELMAVGDLDGNREDEVILDFGSATGVWVNYNDDPLTWRRIHVSSPERLAVGNIDNK